MRTRAHRYHLISRFNSAELSLLPLKLPHAIDIISVMVLLLLAYDKISNTATGSRRTLQAIRLAQLHLSLYHMKSIVIHYCQNLYT